MLGKNRTLQMKQTNPPGRPRPWKWVGLWAGAAAAGLFLISCSAGSAPSGQISVAQAYADVQAGAFILDVRTKAEWDQGHIAGSINIPLDRLSNRLAEVPRDQEVIVVCQTGVRSAEGLAILQRAGYTNAASMTGGMTAWQAAGYPLTLPPGPEPLTPIAPIVPISTIAP
jgi:rhodanese-related sulfurtransferase